MAFWSSRNWGWAATWRSGWTRADGRSERRHERRAALALLRADRRAGAEDRYLRVARESRINDRAGKGRPGRAICPPSGSGLRASAFGGSALTQTLARRRRRDREDTSHSQLPRRRDSEAAQRETASMASTGLTQARIAETQARFREANERIEATAYNTQLLG